MAVNDYRPPIGGRDDPRRPGPGREPSQVIRREPIRQPPPPLRRPPPPPTNRPPVSQPQAKPRRKRRWGRIVVTSTLVLLLVLGVAIVGAGAWIDSSLHRIPALADYAEQPAPGKGTTWLLVGSDSRQNLSPDQQAELATGGDIGNGRTDTILLVHVSGFGSDTPTTMVSIPRDSYVSIPGHGEDKINAAFAIGGAALLSQTVEQAAGIRLDHYAEIGFDGFAEAVDAVGGVTMCPPDPINDPLAGIDLPAGCQKLSGPAALGYVRTRATPRADLDRMTNQREFMSALMHRAASPAVLLNPLRWYPLAHAAAGAVTVDEGAHVWDLVDLAWALHGTVTTTTVPIGDFSGSDVGSVVVWNDDAATRLFQALAADTPVPQDVLDAGHA
jgi:LCP family protein required for cell wall assembly